MEIGIREVKGVSVIDVADRITLDGGDKVLNAVQQVLDAGSRRILLNLGEVNRVDSFGLGQLVAAFTTSRDAGAQLKLLQLTSKVKHLLVITKLVTVFAIEEDEQDAIASFA